MDMAEEVFGAIQPQSRRVNALGITQRGGALGFIQREIMPDSSFEMVCHLLRKPGKIIGSLFPAPATPVLGCLGQFPVVEGHVGFDTRCQAAVNDFIIIGQACRIPASVSVGIDSCPACGEPIGFHTQFLQKGNIFCIPMIGITGNIAIVAVGNLAGGVGKGSPDAGTAAVFQIITLDLVGCRCGAPQEVFREGDHRVTSTATCA